MRRVGWLRVGLLSAVMATGCSVFDPDLLPPEDDGPGNGVDSGPGDSGPDPFDDGCTVGSLRPPPRPTGGTGDEVNIEPLWFALKDVVLSDQQTGLNVDELCTGPEGPWSCLAPAQLTNYLNDRPFSVPVDGPMGLDNMFSREVYSLVNETIEGPDLELTSQTAEAHGYGNPLIEISDYNGQANDSRVTITVTQSVFGLPGVDGEQPLVCIFEIEGEGGMPHQPDPEEGCNLEPCPVESEEEGDPGPCLARIPPLPVELDDEENPTEIVSVVEDWETGNLWFWARDDTYQAGEPIVVIDTAYVVDYTLVARLPDNQIFNFVGQGQAVQARLHGAYAIAKLRPDFSGSEPGEVLVAGRWAVSALLQTAESVGVCQGTPLYAIARQELERQSDVRTRSEDEGVDVPCNAVSFGITFTAHRAHFGGLALGQPIPNPCAEEGDEVDAGVDGGDAGVDGGD
jgi:hypothetical protein